MRSSFTFSSGRFAPRIAGMMATLIAAMLIAHTGLGKNPAKQRLPTRLWPKTERWSPSGFRLIYPSVSSDAGGTHMTLTNARLIGAIPATAASNSATTTFIPGFLESLNLSIVPGVNPLDAHNQVCNGVESAYETCSNEAEPCSEEIIAQYQTCVQIRRVLASAGAPVMAIVVQPDGKYLIAGGFSQVLGVARASIARINADGTLDNGFNASTNGYITSMARQTDGKIIIAGAFTAVNGTAGLSNIARLNADGSLDIAFNSSGGVSLGGTNRLVTTVAVQADGKILIGGAFTSVNNSAVSASTGINYIARLNEDGTLDMNFNRSSGIGLGGANDYVWSIVVQGDGKILIGGAFTSVNGSAVNAGTGINRIARLNQDGSLDAAFNSIGGIGLGGADNDVRSIAVQPDGKILIGGDFSSVNGSAVSASTGINRIARLNPDGSLDPAFNSSGGVGLGGANGQVSSIVVQPDGKILIGGDFSSVNGSAESTATGINRITRLNADGSIDLTFNRSDGIGLGGATGGFVTCMALLGDDKILLGGAFTAVNGTPRDYFAVLSNQIACAEPPTVTCPANTTTINTNAGAACQITIPDYVAALSPTDNCAAGGSIVEAQSVPAGTYSPVSDGQVVTVTYTATDVANNTRYCTVSILVSAPEAEVRGNNVVITDGSTIPNLADHTNFGGTTLGNPIVRIFTIKNTGIQPLMVTGVTNSNLTHFTVGVLSANPIPAGQSATFTVTFNAVALGTYNATITAMTSGCDEANYDFAVSGIVDCVAAGVVSCPGTQTVNAATGLCNAVANYTLTPTGNPAPDVVYTLTGATTGTGHGTGSGLTYNVGTTAVAVSITNPCGSTSCTFNVVVVDNQPPTMTCPAPIVRSTDANLCSAAVSYAPTVTENCPGATFSYVFTGATTGSGTGTGSTSTFLLGVTTVALKVTDGAGAMSNCSFTITVNDTQAPSLTCPASILRSTDANTCGAVVTYANATATDNCGTPTVTQTSGPLVSGSTFPVGTTTVTFRANDAAVPSNSATCSFTVTVLDSQAPSITCPTNQSVGAGAACNAVVSYATPTASDNCTLPTNPVVWVSGGASHATGSPNSSATFSLGQTTVIWRATDAAGLTRTCSFRITVVDVTPPTITCPANQTANAAANSCSSAAMTYPNATAVDNCTTNPTVVRIGGIPSGSLFPAGVNVVAFRAIDGTGRSSTCTFMVTVTDNAPPMITCPQNITQNNPANACNTPVVYANPTATDNCGVNATFLLGGMASGSAFPLGTTSVTWQANDVNGLTAACSFSVTVNCASAKPMDNVSTGAITNQKSKITNLSLVPNPAWGEVRFAVEHSGEAAGELVVVDALGRLVLRQKIAANQEYGTFDVTGWAKGLYQARFRTEKEVVTKGLVVAE